MWVRLPPPAPNRSRSPLLRSHGEDTGESEPPFEGEIDPVAGAQDPAVALLVVSVVREMEGKGHAGDVETDERLVTARIGAERGMVAAVHRRTVFRNRH